MQNFIKTFPEKTITLEVDTKAKFGDWPYLLLIFQLLNISASVLGSLITYFYLLIALYTVSSGQSPIWAMYNIMKHNTHTHKTNDKK